MLLDDIATYLSVHGVTTPISKGLLPDTPDAVLSLYEYPGMAPEYSQEIAAEGIERPRLQVSVRGGAYDYVTPRAVIETVRAALSFANVTMASGVVYQRLRPLQAPFLVERDHLNRVVLAINFDVMKQPG